MKIGGSASQLVGVLRLDARLTSHRGGRKTNFSGIIFALLITGFQVNIISELIHL